MAESLKLLIREGMQEIKYLDAFHFATKDAKKVCWGDDVEGERRVVVEKLTEAAFLVADQCGAQLDGLERALVKLVEDMRGKGVETVSCKTDPRLSLQPAIRLKSIPHAFLAG